MEELFDEIYLILFNEMICFMVYNKDFILSFTYF